VNSTDVLLNVATAARLFHASDGTGFPDLIIDGHRESWPLRSRAETSYAEAGDRASRARAMLTLLTQNRVSPTNVK
jgi:hypothetical protein